MRHMQRILACVLLLIAGVFLFYPWVSIIINNKYHSDVETIYTAAIEDTDKTELTAQREAAEQYNTMLSGAAITEGGHLPLPWRMPSNSRWAASWPMWTFPRSAYTCRYSTARRLKRWSERSAMW